MLPSMSSSGVPPTSSPQDFKWMREVTGDGAHLIASMAGCKEDLRLAAQACNRIQAEFARGSADADIIRLLWTAAVVNYTRPFQKDARDPLPDAVLASCSDGARAYHEEIIAIRNKHLAHSENTMETVLVFLELTDRDVEEPSLKDLGVMHMRRSFQPVDAARLSRLIEEVDWYLKQVLSTLISEARRQLEAVPLDAVYAEPSIAEMQVQRAGSPRERRNRQRGAGSPLRLS